MVGFTLVELLVVISIIALMVSILLPALQKARDTAKATICLSNQRQVAIAMHIYADMSEDTFPKYYDSVADRVWGRTLCESGTLNAHSDALYCPTVPPYASDTSLWREGYGFTYGMPNYRNEVNATFLSNYPSLDGEGYILRLRIEKPSQIFLTVDSWSLRDSVPIYYLDDHSSIDRAVHLRHGSDHANTAKADGSARVEDVAFFKRAYQYVWILHSDNSLTN